MSGAAVAAPAMRTRQRSAEARRKDLLASVATHSVAIALGGCCSCCPSSFVVLTSLMTQRQSLTRDLIPHPIQWSNYRDIFREQPMSMYMQEHGRVLRARRRSASCCRPCRSPTRSP